MHCRARTETDLAKILGCVVLLSNQKLRFSTVICFGALLLFGRSTIGIVKMQSSIELSFTDITEVYLQELRRGHRISIQTLAKQFPQFRDRIITELPTIVALDSDLGGANAKLPRIPNYELMEEIGRGASGIVFKAKHVSGSVFAIKLVRVDRESATVNRLEREIASLSRLKHPNIVSIESFGVCDDYVYIVTNFIEGITLADLCSPTTSLQSRYWTTELQNNWNLLAAWGHEIASALEYIHQAKVIHRDIKPSNLLIDKTGKCWIIDFGLAKLSQSGMTVSRSRQVAGTPRFMAPEQLRGVVDARGDIYSLGRTLYELASRENRFDDSRATLPSTEQVNPAVPPELAKIIDKASDPHPERRYKTANEMAIVLTRYLSGKSPCDRRRLGKRMTEEEFKATMRRRVRYAIVSGLICFVGTTAFLTIPRFRTEVQNPSTSLLNPNKENKSLQKLAYAIENEDKGFVEIIGEAIKHSVVKQNNGNPDSVAVNAKIDRIVEKVTTEGLKPGELDSLIRDYRSSPLMNANKITALHHPLHNSTLSPEEKMRGHATLELLSKAIVNKRVQTEKADRVLASLFQGEIPRLEQIVSLQIPDQVFVSWLSLVENSFSMEFQSLMSEGKQTGAEWNKIIDNFLQNPM